MYDKKSIIRFTTPDIVFSFKSVDATQITVANLYVKGENTTYITRTIDTAEADATTIKWTLSQDETGSLPTGKNVSIVMDWLVGETRGRSEVERFWVEDAGKNKVIE